MGNPEVKARPHILYWLIADVLRERCSFAKKLVDERLKPDAKPGNDMMQSHMRNGLSRKELMAEVFLTL